MCRRLLQIEFLKAKGDRGPTAGHPTIDRPSNAEEFLTLDGISSMYQLAVVREGVLDCRHRGCWCMSCLKFILDDARRNAAEFNVPGCTSAKISADSYRLVRRLATKTGGSGSSKNADGVVQPAIDVALAASSVLAGDWLIFPAGIGEDDEQDDNEPF
jgi:hypothetical protein